jgi:hypothetical protein
MSPPYRLEAPRVALALPANRFPSLRIKFVLFFSFILVIACSALSLYYVEERRTAMTESLQQLGTVLLTSVARNEHFQYAGLVAEDRATLQQFIDRLSRMWCTCSLPARMEACSPSTRREHTNFLPALADP